MASLKKRNNHIGKSRLLIIIYSTILFCTVFITVGFSAFSQTLNISAMANIRAQADIRITNASTMNGINGATSNYEDYNANNITSSINLPYSNSTITYHIEVTNIGNVPQGIYAIDETYKHIGTDTDSNLEIISKTVNLKETLCDDTNSSQCKLGSVTTFDITIGYKNNGYDESKTTHLVQLDFDFRRMFDITYVGFSGDTSGLPSKMIDGDTKTITFDNNSGIPSNVAVTGASGSYSNPTLTLSNITIQNLVDSIVVTRTYSVTYVGFTGNTSSLISAVTASGETITFNNTTGIPTNVIVTGATGNYNNSPNLVLTNVTDDVTISNAYTVTYSGFTNSTSGLPSLIPATGGTIVFDNISGIPTSVTVTNATGDYTNQPNLVLTNVTGNVVVDATFSGNTQVIDNGDGTTTTITETVTNNQDGSTTTISNSVTTDSQGNVTSSTKVETTENTNGSSTSITTNYDPTTNLPISGSTTNTDTSGNVNTQEVEYDSQGQQVVTGYTIDTSNNNNGGETITNGIDTGMLVFDGRDWEATLTAKIDMDNINKSQNINPVINFSKKDENDNKVDGLVIYARLASGTVYNETITSISASNSSPAMRFKINKINNGSVDSNSIDFYSSTPTAYNSRVFGTKTKPITLTFKISCSNNTVSAEIWYNDGIVAKPRYSRTYGFADGLEGVTFELGQYTPGGANSTPRYFNYEVISFEVHKT